MSFKKIRSLAGRLFSEKQQMIIILWLSEKFWNLRKYFLGVEIDYPKEFLINWNEIKDKSSQDKERNFTVYQLIKLHNKIFEGKKTNVIEFGTDREVDLLLFQNLLKKILIFFQLTVLAFIQMRLQKKCLKI